MSAVAIFFGFAWLIVGLVLRHHAVKHAKEFNYSPITYDSSFWLAGAAVAFAVFFFLEI